MYNANFRPHEYMHVFIYIYHLAGGYIIMQMQ